jgi:exosortase
LPLDLVFLDTAEKSMTSLPRHLKFSFFVAGSLVVGWRPLLDTFALALRRDEYTHILLILPISAALVFTDWSSPKIDPKPTRQIGSALLVAAVLIGFSGRFTAPADVRLFLGVLGLVICWLGMFVICFGIGAFWSLLFPLCFLLWLVPIPAPALNKIVAFWQQGSALSASLLFSALGVPVTQDGIMLSIPGLSLEVAQECSSLRSSLMLVVTCMVLAHLFLRSIWRKTTIVLAAIPLSIAKNGVRIFTISMLGTHVDPAFLHGNLHRNGGILFFLLALFAILLLLWLLGRSENRVVPKSSS